MLRKAGYFTAMSGKWHLGYGDWNPTRHGFDRFFGMVESLDTNVGRIVDAIDDRELGKNTLIVFMSDNGGDVHARNAPFSGGKGTLREGGIRSPCIARWTGRLPAGKETRQVAVTMDFSATFLALAGATAPADRPPDGIDLMPVLEGRERPQERTLFWRIALDPWRKNVVPQRAVRQGRWKYVDYPDGRQELFDLASDVAETNDLRDAQPEIAAALERQLNSWEAHVDPPLYDQREAAEKKRASRRK